MVVSVMLMGFWFGVEGKKLVLICLVIVFSCMIVVGWYMLYDMVSIFFLYFLCSSFVSLLMVVVLFVFCRLVIRIMVGGVIVRFSLVVLFL